MSGHTPEQKAASRILDIALSRGAQFNWDGESLTQWHTRFAEIIAEETAPSEAEKLRGINRELVAALEAVCECERARRAGGPDPMDLEGLDNALAEAVQVASAALDRAKEG